jgi:hypothetical protein
VHLQVALGSDAASIVRSEANFATGAKGLVVVDSFNVSEALCDHPRFVFLTSPSGLRFMRETDLLPRFSGRGAT